MEEKTIIVGNPTKLRKTVFLLIGVVLLCVGLLLYFGNFSFCRESIPGLSIDDMRYARNHGYWGDLKDDSWLLNNASLLDVMLFDTANYSGGAVSVSYIIDIGVLFTLFGLIVYLALRSVSITVTNKRVTGTSSFGRRVDLPIDEISAVGSRLSKGIEVATSSGKILFQGINNRDEVHKAITDMLMERQSKSDSSLQIKTETPQSAADEIEKFKALLDRGILTQEEFDAKKKQLLGL